MHLNQESKENINVEPTINVQKQEEFQHNPEIDQPYEQEVEIKNEPVDKKNDIKDKIKQENIYQAEFYPEDQSISHDKSLEKENLGVLDPYNINSKKEDYRETLKNFAAQEENDGMNHINSNQKVNAKPRKKKKKRLTVYQEDQPQSIQIQKVEDIDNDQKSIERSAKKQNEPSSIMIPEITITKDIQDEEKEETKNQIWGTDKKTLARLGDPADEYSPSKSRRLELNRNVRNNIRHNGSVQARADDLEEEKILVTNSDYNQKSLPRSQMAHSDYSESPEKHKFSNMKQISKRDQMKQSIHSSSSKSNFLIFYTFIYSERTKGKIGY